MSASTTSERLRAWVNEWAGVLQPRDVHWCDGSAEEYDELCQQLVESGTFTQARRGQATQQLLGAQRPGRRRPRGRPHLHLFGRGRRCRSHQQLARPRDDARRHDDAVHRRDEGPNDVRGAVQHGSARVADRPHRCAADR